ncbi:MAG: HAMP domain-containing histidine kinase [Bacteroidetes bacterium]|nr:HAMP domain-containing histidine kinase [Bacteroidota bacterium]
MNKQKASTKVTFSNMNLLAKFYLIIMPLFLIAVALSIYLNYTHERNQVLELTESFARTQAMAVYNLVTARSYNNMVAGIPNVTQGSEEHGVNIGNVKHLQFQFQFQNLHLDSNLLRPENIERLKQLQRADILDGHLLDEIKTTSSTAPLCFFKGDSVEAFVSLRAEKKCQSCHDVPVGAVIGVVHMYVSTPNVTSVMRANWARSVWAFLIFAIVGSVVGVTNFKFLVLKPVRRLVQATEVVGSGNLDFVVDEGGHKDELGKLARSFNNMRERLKQVQSELIRKERLSTIGQMAGSIVHDLRNPITTTRLALESLQMTCDQTDERLSRIFSIAHNSLDRMSTMTQELLDFSRGEIRLQLEIHDVEEFVNSISSAAVRQLDSKKIHLIVHHGCAGSARFDDNRLERALFNIINNAEDAISKDGEILLVTDREDGHIVFRISDTGCGIPVEIHDKIFDPFVTFGKRNGTGLGLAVTKRIIEQHHGEIFFESGIDKGTTFTVRIPTGVESSRFMKVIEVTAQTVA